MKTWTASEVSSILAHTEGDDPVLFPLWRLLAITRLRRGEALGVRWRELELDAGRLAVRNTLLAVNNGLLFGEPKTKKGRRLIAMDATTVAVLKAHRMRMAAERLAAGDARKNVDLVFTGGRPLHPDRISKLFRRHVGELPDQGRVGATRPRQRLDDARCLFARHTGNAGGSSRNGRWADC